MSYTELQYQHAKKQAHADGFQTGWHAALKRIHAGDKRGDLVALVPAPARPETSAPPALAWIKNWIYGNDEWQQCRACGVYVQLRYGKEPTGKSLEHHAHCLVALYAAALQHIEGLTAALDQSKQDQRRAEDAALQKYYENKQLSEHIEGLTRQLAEAREQIDYLSGAKKAREIAETLGDGSDLAPLPAPPAAPTEEPRR